MRSHTLDNKTAVFVWKIKWATIHIHKILHNIFKPPETQVQINSRLKFCFHLTENMQDLHYKVQSDNEIKEDTVALYCVEHMKPERTVRQKENISGTEASYLFLTLSEETK